MFVTFNTQLVNRNDDFENVVDHDTGPLPDWDRPRPSCFGPIVEENGSFLHAVIHF